MQDNNYICFMRKIMKVSDFVSAPNRQFIILDNYFNETNKELNITKVSRLKDGREFELFEIICKRNIIVSNISLTEEIEITLFDDDMIHIYIQCSIFSQHMKDWAGREERIQIDDIDEIIDFIREEARNFYVENNKNKEAF